MERNHGPVTALETLHYLPLRPATAQQGTKTASLLSWVGN